MVSSKDLFYERVEIKQRSSQAEKVRRGPEQVAV